LQSSNRQLQISDRGDYRYIFLLLVPQIPPKMAKIGISSSKFCIRNYFLKKIFRREDSYLTAYNLGGIAPSCHDTTDLSKCWECVLLVGSVWCGEWSQHHNDIRPGASLLHAVWTHESQSNTSTRFRFPYVS